MSKRSLVKPKLITAKQIRQALEASAVNSRELQKELRKLSILRPEIANIRFR